ncbi:hypothetical protein [Anaerovorax sp. IOR16]|uniref:hypothetical protein n=1 Tax=Anaerovorax sp. IOR16 TaxID=2773458 RepID=UPI0019D13509|nr:hypothetical protein [Anaerovorax sp. IOR16]
MMKYRDSKSQIFLMEFIIVILFFSICVTICLKAFVEANQMSEESKRINHAILIGESAAECIKASDYKEIDDKLSSLVYPQVKEKEYNIEVKKQLKNQMLEATIIVSDIEKKDIYELKVKKYTPGEVQ